jgi:hypothetical protein
MCLLFEIWKLIDVCYSPQRNGLFTINVLFFMNVRCYFENVVDDKKRRETLYGNFTEMTVKDWNYMCMAAVTFHSFI